MARRTFQDFNPLGTGCADRCCLQASSSTSGSHCVNRTSSTVTHIYHSSTAPSFHVHTLKPDETFRANPHGRLRDHIHSLNEQWAKARDTILAAPFQAEWWAFEHYLSEARKAAHTAHLRCQAEADKAWLLRKLYLRAIDYYAMQRQRKVEERSGAELRRRLDERYLAQQLEQRKIVAEAQLSSAALEMSSGDRLCGRFLRYSYFNYLSEDAGRI